MNLHCTSKNMYVMVDTYMVKYMVNTWSNTWSIHEQIHGRYIHDHIHGQHMVNTWSTTWSNTLAFVSLLLDHLLPRVIKQAKIYSHSDIDETCNISQYISAIYFSIST